MIPIEDFTDVFAVFVYFVFVYFVFARFMYENVIFDILKKSFFSLKIYHMLGLSGTLSYTVFVCLCVCVFVCLCICVFVFVYLIVVNTDVHNSPQMNIGFIGMFEISRNHHFSISLILPETQYYLFHIWCEFLKIGQFTNNFHWKIKVEATLQILSYQHSKVKKRGKHLRKFLL